MIPFHRNNIGQEEADALARVALSGNVAHGKEAHEFEQEFADYVGVKYAIFTNSCTSALKIAYSFLKYKGYKGVSYPANTFVATYSAALEAGLEIYPRGGYDGSKCQSQSISVQDAKQNLKTLITVTEENSVQSHVIELAEKELGYPYLRNSKKDTELVPALNSENRPNILYTEKTLVDINRFTTGSNVNSERLKNVSTVGQPQESGGQTKIIGIQRNEKIGNVCAEDVTTYTTPKTILGVNVHFAGELDTCPCLVEDSAHRIEPNDPLIGLFRCYSFHGTKAMTTGHGGMLVTNDKEAYEFARLVNDDGIKRKPNGDKATWDYNNEFIKGGYDGSDLNAAMGREQLKKLPKFMERRREILKMYNEGLGTDWQGTLFYVHFLKDKEEVGKFIDYMTEKGIGTAYHYPGTGWLGVSLPLYPSLTDEEVNYIIETVKEFK